jgi:hypothetical protein
MRSAGNFHPEWGCLSPSPNLARSLCVALVATAIGATSGAVVMNLLIERPGLSGNIPSVAASALVSKAPVIVAPVGTASFINATAAAALIARSAQAKPAVADRPQPATDATPALTACVLPSAHMPSGTASLSAGRSSGTGSAEKRSIVKASAASTARAAKAEARKRVLPTRRHWQTATNGWSYQRYDQKFRPSFQPPDSRPFAQAGYSEPPHDW